MGTSSGGMRLPIVVHHEGDDIPFDNPAPARPTSNVAGVNSFADDITTRNAIEAMRRIFAISKMARRFSRVRRRSGEQDRQNPRKRSHRRGEGHEHGKSRQTLHDEPADQGDHPDTEVGEQASALEPAKCPATQRREQFPHRPTQQQLDGASQLSAP